MMQGRLDDKRREHLCKLLSKLFEDLLSEDETVLLEAMLSESEEARLLYMQYVDLQVELGCLVVEEHMQNKLVRFPSSISKRKANKIPARRFAEAAVILVGIGMGLLWFFNRDGVSVEENQVARLTNPVGDVSIEVESKRSDLLEGMVMEYRPGDILRTEGAGSSVVLSYTDGSQFKVWSNSEVVNRAETGKIIELIEGAASADITEQHEKHPLMIRTPMAELTVVGTAFTVNAGKQETAVSVFDGEVRLKRLQDAKKADLGGGEFITITAKDMLVREMLDPGGLWEENLEKPFPKHVSAEGMFFNDKKYLPKGSYGAMKSVITEKSGQKTHWVMALPKDWNEGYFTIYPDSYLNITYKYERLNSSFQLVMDTRVFTPNQDPRATYVYMNEALTSEKYKKQWRSVSIPVRKFQGDSGERGTYPGGDVACGLTFHAVGEHSGFIIDKVWVTRGAAPGCTVLAR